MKVKILDCIINSEEVSQNLKGYAQSMKESKNKKLNFRGINLEPKDRKIIRNCKKNTFYRRFPGQRENIPELGRHDGPKWGKDFRPFGKKFSSKNLLLL